LGTRTNELPTRAFSSQSTVDRTITSPSKHLFTRASVSTISAAHSHMSEVISTLNNELGTLRTELISDVGSSIDKDRVNIWTDGQKYVLKDHSQDYITTITPSGDNNVYLQDETKPAPRAPRAVAQDSDGTLQGLSANLRLKVIYENHRSELESAWESKVKAIEKIFEDIKSDPDASLAFQQAYNDPARLFQIEEIIYKDTKPLAELASILGYIDAEDVTPLQISDRGHDRTAASSVSRR